MMRWHSSPSRHIEIAQLTSPMNETRKRQASELPPQDASFKKSALGIETFEVQPEIEV